MTPRALLLDALLADPGKAALVPREEAVALLIELARVEKALELQALSPAPTVTVADKGEDRLLDVHEAAARLGLSDRQLYRRAKRLPFAMKLGKATLRFSARGLQRYLTADGGAE